MFGNKKDEAPAKVVREPRNYNRGNGNSLRGLRRGLDPYAMGRAGAVAMQRKQQHEKEGL